MQAMLSAASQSAVDLSIRQLVDLGIDIIKDGQVTGSELSSFFHGATATLVIVVEEARDTHANPLMGIDKRDIVVKALQKLLRELKPYITTTVLGLLAMSAPPWLRFVLWVASKLWDASIIDRLADSIPSTIEVVLSTLKIAWAKA